MLFLTAVVAPAFPGALDFRHFGHSVTGTGAVVFGNGIIVGEAGVTLQSGRMDKKYLHIKVTGSGKGTVLVTPSLEECGRSDTDCSFGFNPATVVTLTAQGTETSVFEGWIGDCALVKEDGENACRIKMDDDKYITAVFTLIKEKTFPLP